jgi:hypothetical protein
MGIFGYVLAGMVGWTLACLLWLWAAAMIMGALDA